METFTREQITKVIDDCEKTALANPKNCFASAMDQTLEAVREYFNPFCHICGQVRGTEHLDFCSVGNGIVH